MSTSQSNNANNADSANIAATLSRIEQHLAQLAQLACAVAPPSAAVLDNADNANNSGSWRWQATPLGGALTPLPPSSPPPLSCLLALDDAIAAAEKNTRRFLSGKPANHMLLTGARGCGKSSIVRGVFGKYRRRGLRLIETDMAGLAQLPALQTLLAARREKYFLYCDDLAFKDGDQNFSRIKSAIDGALASAADNLLLVATSNRRNIIAEKFSDNLSALSSDVVSGVAGGFGGGKAHDAHEDIQPLETQDEKIALADRFGLWLSFYPPSSEQYDSIVAHWLRHFNITPRPALIQAGRNFADQRGSRNGRIARQFAISCIS